MAVRGSSCTAVAVAVTFALALTSTRTVAAQSLERRAETETACRVRTQTLAVGNADVQVSVAAAVTSEGALVVYRTLDARLVLARSTAAGMRRGDDRELANGAGAFALAAQPGGVTVVFAEHEARGEPDAVLLARVADDGEARNVPRVVARTDVAGGVAVAWTSSGALVAWGARAGEAPGTLVVATDARGVPRTEARRVGGGTQPALVGLAGGSSVVFSAGRNAGPNGANEGAVQLDADGNVMDRSESWASSAGVSAAANGVSVVGVSADEGATGTSAGAGMTAGTTANANTGASSWVLSRWIPGTGTAATSLAPRVLAANPPVALASDRSGVIALLAPRNGRSALVRLGADGTVVPVATVVGTRAAFASTPDGTLAVIAHGAPGQVVLSRVECGW